jgi:7-carboxy-7-deazaguanine synthase
MYAFRSNAVENTQVREPLAKNDKELDVHSIWETIQGEGPLVGSPAVFVRLSGCNLQCPLCDTDYTSNRKMWSPDHILKVVSSLRKKGLVVITGGEPFRQQIGPLVYLLLRTGYQVQVETNGSIYQRQMPYGSFMVICSPKSPTINSLLGNYVSAYKYVVQAGHIDSDGFPTRVLGTDMKVARPTQKYFHPSEIYIQPADEQDEVRNAANLKAALEVCFKHGYRMCIQTHKILGLA